MSVILPIVVIGLAGLVAASVLRAKGKNRLATLFVRGSERRRVAVARLRGRVLCDAMAHLGATFIKLGQVMSTRPDLFDRELIDELRGLQDRLPPFPTETARAIVEEELGAPIEAHFLSFEEPVAAFKNLRTALAPGGRLAFVCWRAFADNEWAALPMAVASEFMTHPPADPIAPGPFAFADKKRVEGILAEAGFRDIAIEPRDSIMDQGATIDEAVTTTLTFGPLSRAAAEIDEATRTKLRARLKATIPTKPSAAVWLVSARQS